MQKNNKKARNGRSKRMKTDAVREVRVINLHEVCGSIDQDALNVLTVVTKGRRTNLFNKVTNALLGLDPKVQAYAAESVALYYAGHARTHTCLPSVDGVLNRLYKAVDDALAAAE